VYTSGLVRASQVVVDEVLALLARYPTIEEVSFIGNSFGSLVLQHAARSLWRRYAAGLMLCDVWIITSNRKLGCKFGCFVSFPAPHFGITSQTLQRLGTLRRVAMKLVCIKF
jgi:hypothetical protein